MIFFQIYARFDGKFQQKFNLVNRVKFESIAITFPPVHLVRISSISRPRSLYIISFIMYSHYTPLDLQ